MRTRIKVMDLTLRQWDHLQDNLRTEYEIPTDAVRVSVEFELDAQISARYVDMPVRAFVALMTQLQRIETHAEVQEGLADLPPLPADSKTQRAHARSVVKQAAHAARLPVLPTADEVRNLSAADAVALAGQMNEPTCDHGSPVKAERPSAFEGAEPVRDYVDGCQSYGPYQPLSQTTFRSDT